MSAIPPVRRTVPLRRGDAATGRRDFSGLFPGREVHLFDSGSSALAVALQDARLHHGSVRPEVILPAYGCPQLVSACLQAAVRPRLVDTAHDQWGYDLQQLRAALTVDTVAVVAVNLLGVGDQAGDLLPLARANGSALIQDSAQYLPTSSENDWRADYVVLSFGRGKPLNLLRGGALAISGDRRLRARIDGSTGARGRIKQAVLGSRAAALAFNTITHPSVYGFAARLPGLGVGLTSYEPLEAALAAPESMWGELGPAFQAYCRERSESPWAGYLAGWERFGVRSLTCLTAYPIPTAVRRLRWALLAPDAQRRELLVDTLGRRGLGASSMYAVALRDVTAIPAEVVAQGPFPNASRLAAQLFTLPTHASVTADIAAETDRLVAAALSR